VVHTAETFKVIRAGPSPGFSNRGGGNQKGGPKSRRGGHNFKIQY